MKRTLWVVVKRYYLKDEDSKTEPDEEFQEIILDGDPSSESIIELFRKRLALPDSGIVLKLRNHRGSLIPVNSSIQANWKSVPYQLEVVREHQYIKPKEKTMKRKMYNESMKKVMSEFMQRLDRLEEKVPDIGNRQQERTDQVTWKKIHSVKDMKYIEGKLVFLNKRFEEAGHSNWCGMFKKNPMW